jgi:hypothetical protein
MTCREAKANCLQLNAEAEASGWPMRCDSACVFATGELNDLRDLWLSKADGTVPARTRFDMRTLKPYTRNVAILEKVETPGGHSYRFRLFGSALTLIFGEHTGRRIEEMVMPALLPGWIAFYDTVLASAMPMRLINFYRTTSNTFLKGELLAAPLADEQGEVRFVLLATYVDFKDLSESPFAAAGPLTA